jgi:hypothetical protein
VSGLEVFIVVRPAPAPPSPAKADLAARRSAIVAALRATARPVRNDLDIVRADVDVLRAVVRDLTVRLDRLTSEVLATREVAPEPQPTITLAKADADGPVAPPVPPLQPIDVGRSTGSRAFDVLLGVERPGTAGRGRLGLVTAD